MMFVVEFGVKGAARIKKRTFDTREQADAAADRWRRSNSTGEYWAEVAEAGTQPDLRAASSFMGGIFRGETTPEAEARVRRERAEGRYR